MLLVEFGEKVVELVATLEPSTMAQPLCAVQVPSDWQTKDAAVPV